ncbi:unnamed protein product [Macrosiphum euphorbiae]|uniref:ATP-dependent DNA helicase n=1 Tax=Macrosiphum euphorbiae TaxID=13131 RepID=A0AAV0W8D4_9HEMI|nr:unnamed protein product [Macrosiphum euphorbiae]
MSHKSHIDPANMQTFKYLTSEKTMGGVTFVVLTWNFGQTLPVVHKGTRSGIINLRLKKSEVWNGSMSKDFN